MPQKQSEGGFRLRTYVVITHDDKKIFDCKKVSFQKRFELVVQRKFPLRV